MDPRNTEQNEVPPEPKGKQPSFEHALADRVATEYREGRTEQQYSLLRQQLEQGQQLSWEDARWMASVESTVLLQGNPLLGDLSQIGMNFWRINRAYNAVEGKAKPGEDILLIGGMQTYPEVMGLLLKPPTAEDVVRALPTLSGTSLEQRKAEIRRQLAASQQPTVTPPEYYSANVVAVDPSPRMDAIEQAARSAYQFPETLHLVNAPTTVEEYLAQHPTDQYDVMSWQRFPPMEFFSPTVSSLAAEEIGAGKLDESLPHYPEVAHAVNGRLDLLLSHIKPQGRLQLIGGYGNDDVGRESRIVPLKLADRDIVSNRPNFEPSLTILTPVMETDKIQSTTTDRQTFSSQANHSAMLRVQRTS